MTRWYLTRPEALSGGLLPLTLTGHEGRSVEIRLVRRLYAAGGTLQYDEDVLATWDSGGVAEHQLRLPRVDPTWIGEHVGIEYFIEAAGVRAPFTIWPGTPPPEAERLRAVRHQRDRNQLQADRRRWSGCLQTIAEVLLTVGSLGALLTTAGLLLSGHQLTTESALPALGALLWLPTEAFFLARRVRDRLAHLGWIEPPDAPLGGVFHGRALRPLRWRLIRSELYSVAIDLDGAWQPRWHRRTVAQGHTARGPFEIPITAEQPASVTGEHAGVSWSIELEADGATQRHPVIVLPWLAPQKARTRHSPAPV